MTNKRLLVIGQFALILGFVGFSTNYLYFDSQIIFFLVGVLLGLALIFNITFLLKIRKKAAHNKV